MMIQKIIHMSTYAIVAVLVIVFIVRGVIFPIADKIKTEVVTATTSAEPDSAAQKLSSEKGDTGEDGQPVQSEDASQGGEEAYSDGDGDTTSDKAKARIALTFDDGPGQYTDKLLDCIEENNVHVTFFMLGENVEKYPETVKRMKKLGCELGNHSWNHPELLKLSLDAVKQQFDDTDNALIEACGQAATVARAPFGSGSQEIYQTVQKPFFMWSLDTLDWKALNADADYEAVIKGDLTDGSIILMHDIHQPSVEAALNIIPELVKEGYELMTVSELAQAKDIDLQYARYTDFWDSSLASGSVAGYKGSIQQESSNSSEGISDGNEVSGNTYSDGNNEDFGDGSGSMGYSDGQQS